MINLKHAKAHSWFAVKPLESGLGLNESLVKVARVEIFAIRQIGTQPLNGPVMVFDWVALRKVQDVGDYDTTQKKIN